MTTKTARKPLTKSKPLARVLALGIGSPLWKDRNKTPSSKGWYITRRDDGEMSWRAWGNDAWWKQIKGGWIECFDGDGCAMRFEWMPRTRKSIDLNSDQLPDVSEYLFDQPESPSKVSLATTANNAPPCARPVPGGL